jgi:hypothetical protein
MPSHATGQSVARIGSPEWAGCRRGTFSLHKELVYAQGYRQTRL